MKRILALCLILCVVFSIPCFAQADEQLQYHYSTEVNSGIRHEVCTTLLGTSAADYYTGAYTYSELAALDSSALLATLRQLMTDTHTRTSSYNDCRDMAELTDCENGDGTSINLIYTSYSSSWADWINNNSQGWNREHVWPQSLGGFKTSGPGADLHHVRPSDQKVNSVRGNMKYGNAEGGSEVKGTSATKNALGGYKTGAYFEPLDNAKGDVARIILYMYVRYGGDYSSCSSVTNVFESVDVLLQWCALDPVDTWEMGRNEVVAAYQGNRNVFVDYPELAWLLFGQEIPQGLVTPSGNSAAEPPACTHSQVEVRNQADTTCTADGYTGDTYCADCGELLSYGESSSAYGHRFLDWLTTQEPTATTDGLMERECDICGFVEAQSIPATGETEPVETEPPATESPETEPPVTEPPVTEPPATDPTETEPVVTDPTETDPIETEPTETNPPETDPIETDPVQTDPTETTPAPANPKSPTFPWPILLVVLLVAGVAATLILSKRKK